jgi:hypothetical protein
MTYLRAGVLNSKLFSCLSSLLVTYPWNINEKRNISLVVLQENCPLLPHPHFSFSFTNNSYDLMEFYGIATELSTQLTVADSRTVSILSPRNE